MSVYPKKEIKPFCVNSRLDISVYPGILSSVKIPSVNDWMFTYALNGQSFESDKLERLAKLGAAHIYDTL